MVGFRGRTKAKQVDEVDDVQDHMLRLRYFGTLVRKTTKEEMKLF